MKHAVGKLPLSGMEIKIYCPLWGHEHLDIADFCHKIKAAGYDGIDTWIPEEPLAKGRLFDAISREELLLVSHQYQAQGKTFDEFKQSFLHYLELSYEGNPVMINSHSGRDYFTLEQNLALIDIATAFSERRGITVAHETHRGRIGYSPAVMKDYFKERPDMLVTADLSHWVCVSESYLENFSDVLELAIAAARHIHARVGFEEGPQIPDPRAPEWAFAVNHFLGWWDRIVENRRKAGAVSLGITTEFGPPPYMPTKPFTNVPVADQFAINCYMKDLLRERYR
jgi:sugar phosphate isomerase/epimerase